MPERFVSLSSNASAASDAPDYRAQVGTPGLCGARPIQLFEGSRPWGGIYANSIVVGLREGLRKPLQIALYPYSDGHTRFHELFVSVTNRQHCVREPVIGILDSDEDGKETA